MKHDKIAVIDLGGHDAHLVGAQVRRLHVFAEVLAPDTPCSALLDFQGIILSGGTQPSHHDVDPGVFDLPIPILGLGTGHLLMAKHDGAQIQPTTRELGSVTLRLIRQSGIVANLPQEQMAWADNQYVITKIPLQFQEVATIEETSGRIRNNAIIVNEPSRRYALQFHPEEESNGVAMLSNFVLQICGCKPTWTMERHVKEKLVSIRKQVGDKGVFLLASGGVDSTVCAGLLGKALGPDKLHLLHIDNGMMRKNESSSVLAEFERLGLGKNLHFVDASERFLSALEGVVEPEKKRHIIGTTFIEVFGHEAARLSLTDMLLGQGTIYPDRRESEGSEGKAAIKTHHNRVPLVEEWIARGRVIEPLGDLYKPEVRELGQHLGIDSSLLLRHPFPGPGLGVRVLGSDGSFSERQEVQSLVDEQTHSFGLEGRLLPVHSVGMKANQRVYEQPVVLWGPWNHRVLVDVASRICTQIPGVNRCVYDLTGRGVFRAEPVAAGLSKERLDLLREADDIVMRALERHHVMESLWQCPTVLLPLRLDGRGKEVVVLRPVSSQRALKASPMLLPLALVQEILDPILDLPGIGGVMLDLTSKPPGTIEWE